MLIQTKTVLEYDVHSDEDELVIFALEGEEDEDRAYVLIMDTSIWNEMDSPQKITMTLNPGDLLNVEDN